MNVTLFGKKFLVSVIKIKGLRIRAAWAIQADPTSNDRCSFQRKSEVAQAGEEAAREAQQPPEAARVRTGPTLEPPEVSRLCRHLDLHFFSRTEDTFLKLCATRCVTVSSSRSRTLTDGVRGHL